MSSTILLAQIATQPIGAALLSILLLLVLAISIVGICWQQRAKSSVSSLAQFIREHEDQILPAGCDPDLIDQARAALGYAHQYLHAGQVGAAAFLAHLWLDRLQQELQAINATDCEDTYTEGELVWCPSRRSNELAVPSIASV